MTLPRVAQSDLSHKEWNNVCLAAAIRILGETSADDDLGEAFDDLVNIAERRELLYGDLIRDVSITYIEKKKVTL